MAVDLKNIKDEDLIQLYPDLISELKQRGIIRTNNIVGELGEYFAVKIFNDNSNLPKLQKALASTENVDANSSKGQRYSIKSTSSRQTGVFHSESLYNTNSPCFEYLLVITWDKNYQVEYLIQYTWEQFVEYRKMKNPEKNIFSILTKR